MTRRGVRNMLKNDLSDCKPYTQKREVKPRPIAGLKNSYMYLFHRFCTYQKNEVKQEYEVLQTRVDSASVSVNPTRWRRHV